MFCGKCGCQNDNSLQFCRNCGEKLQEGREHRNFLQKHNPIVMVADFIRIIGVCIFLIYAYKPCFSYTINGFLGQSIIYNDYDFWICLFISIIEIVIFCGKRRVKPMLFALLLSFVRAWFPYYHNMVLMQKMYHTMAGFSENELVLKNAEVCRVLGMIVFFWAVVEFFLIVWMKRNKSVENL